MIPKSRESQECFEKAREIFAEKGKYIVLEGPLDDEIFSIHLKNFTDILYALENFGDLIEFLNVNFEHISGAQGKEIVQRINNHCSSLRYVHLEKCHGNMLDDLNSEFSAVNILHFSSHPTEKLVINVNKKLHEIFPNISFLHVGNMKTADNWAFIQGKYNLVCILDVIEELDEANEAHLINLLQLNTQVTSLTIHFPTLRLLSKLKDAMTHISFLCLTSLSQDYFNHDAVEIKGLNTFIFKSKSEDEIPTKIDLRQMKGLELRIPFKFSNQWIDFLKTQVNEDLRELKLITNELEKEQLFTISEHLANLEVVTIESESNFTINDIVEFVEKNKKLQRLDLFAKMDESELVNLGEALGEKWNVQYEKREDNINVRLEK